MGKEIELAYYGIDYSDLINKLKANKARFLGKQYLKRANFQIKTRGKVGSQNYYTSWVRIRTDGKRSTLTLKEQSGNDISGRREYEIEVSSFEGAIRIISKLLPNQKIDYFENSREIYELNGVKLFIDKFPRMPYLLEIEGKTKKIVENVSAKLQIKGEIDSKKSVPTSEYYKMHKVDYSKVQKAYQKKIVSLIKE